MIKRNLQSALEKHLNEKEITLIVGPRQAGKTTLMFLLKEGLEKKGEKTLYLNLDIESDRKYFSSQSKLVEKIKLEIGTGRGVVFIDEIQRKEDAGVFLKGIYDMNLPYKLVISGSGSIELKEHIHESLAGRKRVFELSTINFTEFANYKTEYKYEQKLQDFFSLETEKARSMLLEYLNFGGYPRVILSDTIEEKSLAINEIYQSYLIRDISYLLHVKKTDDFSSLLKLMASQIGNLINASELCRTLGISQQTVKQYLWYLQQTYILHKITPYFKNVRKEITKSPIFYFSDMGLRNYILGIFGKIEDPRDFSFLFENFVFTNLHEKLRDTSSIINFWRTKSHAEVDFVINSGKNLTPIEVKYQDLKKPIITRSFRSFMEQYRPQQAFVINLSLDHQMAIDDTIVRVCRFTDPYLLSSGEKCDP